MVRFAIAIALTIFFAGTSARGAEIVLLDFWSPSCGPCMQMKPVVKALEDKLYPIRAIDTSRDWQLARQFNVDRIPCFVMLVDGAEVDREVGFTSSERLQQMFQKAKDVVAQRPRLQSPDHGPPQTIPVTQPSADGPGAPNAAPQWPAPQPGATVPATPGQTVSQGPINEATTNMLAATVRLTVEDAQGRSFGTGTVVDARSGEALVVTCGHLFRDSKGKTPVTVELFEAGPNGVRVLEKVTGQVISFDLERDIAMVSIRTTRTVAMAPVAPPRTSVERGDRVVNIGCSNGQDPTVLETRVTSLDRYQGPPNIEAAGAPVEGRSGGGLFNVKGQLVGVCFAADHEGNEGLYSALESIHGELDRLGLKEVYAKGEGLAANQPPITRGQEERLAPITPIGADEGARANETTLSVDSGKASAEPPKGLNATEQAAWDEIMSRASKYEVVVIVRPQEPGGQSEVITLNGVSPEFAKALAERQKSPQAPVTR